MSISFDIFCIYTREIFIVIFDLLHEYTFSFVKPISISGDTNSSDSSSDVFSG